MYAVLAIHQRKQRTGWNYIWWPRWAYVKLIMLQENYKSPHMSENPILPNSKNGSEVTSWVTLMGSKNSGATLNIEWVDTTIN